MSSTCMPHIKSFKAFFEVYDDSSQIRYVNTIGPSTGINSDYSGYDTPLEGSSLGESSTETPLHIFKNLNPPFEDTEALAPEHFRQWGQKYADEAFSDREALRHQLLNHYNLASPLQNHQHLEIFRNHSSGSSRVNSVLWQKKETPVVKGMYFRHHLKPLDEALHSYKTPTDFHTFTGLFHSPHENYGPLKSGLHTYHHPAYLSTSLKYEMAHSLGVFQRHGSFDREKHVLVIHVPQGHPGAYIESISKHPKEREFLLPRSTKLRIHSEPLITSEKLSVAVASPMLHTHLWRAEVE